MDSIAFWVNIFISWVEVSVGDCDRQGGIMTCEIL